MPQLSISAAASSTLDLWLDDVMRGRLAIHRLPSPVAAFYHAGAADGVKAAEAEVTELRNEIIRLNAEADRLYGAAFAPKELATRQQAAMDQHFETQCREFFATDTPELSNREAA